MSILTISLYMSFILGAINITKHMVYGGLVYNAVYKQYCEEYYITNCILYVMYVTFMY